MLRAQDELGAELEIAFKPGLADRDPERFLDYALALPQRIAEADGKHVIVFIDEFQEVANPRKPYGDTDAVTKRMRAIFQRSPDVSFLFAAATSISCAVSSARRGKPLALREHLRASPDRAGSLARRHRRTPRRG